MIITHYSRYFVLREANCRNLRESLKNMHFHIISSIRMKVYEFVHLRQRPQKPLLSYRHNGPKNMHFHVISACHSHPVPPSSIISSPSFSYPFSYTFYTSLCHCHQGFILISVQLKTLTQHLFRDIFMIHTLGQHINSNSKHQERHIS